MSDWVPAPTGKITDNFSWTEAKCRHCGRVPSVAAVVNTARWMERLREALGGRSIHVNSWCRCPTHNKKVGGSSGSYHLRGWAVDITVKGLTPKQVHQALVGLQGQGEMVGGLGRYHSFTHVDRGPVRNWNGP
jgi:uncharacterized protein YcbK (DUF882 family)